jgi:hypothetical protein
MAPRIVSCIVCALGANPHSGCINTPNLVIITIATTSLPASTATALPTAGDAITDGIFTGKIANATSEANMPTVCRIITTAQYSNVSDGAVSSNSSNADIVPRVSLVLVSMNSLIK